MGTCSPAAELAGAPEAVCQDTPGLQHVSRHVIRTSYRAGTMLCCGCLALLLGRVHPLERAAAVAQQRGQRSGAFADSYDAFLVGVAACVSGFAVAYCGLQELRDAVLAVCCSAVQMAWGVGSWSESIGVLALRHRLFSRAHYQLRDTAVPLVLSRTTMAGSVQQ
jgi:hypothetical protein